MPRIRSKRWCITLNNYTEDEERIVRQLDSHEQVQYLICGREVGASGTPHLQIYLETKNRSGLRSIKRMLSNRCHIEKANGTLKQNQDYCKKEGDFFEIGEPLPTQGSRTDLQAVKMDLDAGKTDEEIAESHFSQWVRYHQSFTRYRALRQPDRTWKTITIVLWGRTGTGKSRYCMDQVMDRSVWTPGDYQWFDGYTGQQLVILDDYRGEYPIQLLLKLIDRYPMQVPVKGGFVKWLPKKVYITSNVNPLDWYPKADSRSRAALKRRFSRVNKVDIPLYDDITLEEEFLL